MQKTTAARFCQEGGVPVPRADLISALHLECAKKVILGCIFFIDNLLKISPSDLGNGYQSPCFFQIFPVFPVFFPDTKCKNPCVCYYTFFNLLFLTIYTFFRFNPGIDCNIFKIIFKIQIN